LSVLQHLIRLITERKTGGIRRIHRERETNAHKVLIGNISKKVLERKDGTTSKTYAQQQETIKTGLKKIEYKDVDRIHLAQDRDKWRLF
jgi:hypothetical protein